MEKLSLRPRSPSCLIVDDNAPLRRALARILRDACAIETREVEDGIRALTVLEQRRFDVLVCDELMPGPRGHAVLEAAKERWPEMRRVLYTAESRAEQFDQGFADLVLDKMLEPEKVAEYICQLAKEGRTP